MPADRHRLDPAAGGPLLRRGPSGVGQDAHPSGRRRPGHPRPRRGLHGGRGRARGGPEPGARVGQARELGPRAVEVAVVVDGHGHEQHRGDLTPGHHGQPRRGAKRSGPPDPGPQGERQHRVGDGGHGQQRQQGPPQQGHGLPSPPADRRRVGHRPDPGVGRSPSARGTLRLPRRHPHRRTAAPPRPRQPSGRLVSRAVGSSSRTAGAAGPPRARGASTRAGRGPGRPARGEGGRTPSWAPGGRRTGPARPR